MADEKKYPETLEAAIAEIKTLESNLATEKEAHCATAEKAQKDATDASSLIAELSSKIAAEEKDSTTKSKHQLEIEVESEDQAGKKVKESKTFRFAKTFKANHNGTIVTAEDVLADKELAAELAACNVFEEVKA